MNILVVAIEIGITMINVIGNESNCTADSSIIGTASATGKFSSDFRAEGNCKSNANNINGTKDSNANNINDTKDTKHYLERTNQQNVNRHSTNTSISNIRSMQ